MNTKKREPFDSRFEVIEETCHALAGAATASWLRQQGRSFEADSVELGLTGRRGRVFDGG